MIEEKSNDSIMIITHALEELKKELGPKFNLESVNLADLERRTGISRAKLRKFKENNFVEKPHGNLGRKASVTILTGYTSVIDGFLQNSITNSEVIYERLHELGYSGGKTSIKDYVKAHADLVPPKRQIVAVQGNRGRRYSTGPGESYQMDWGFVKVIDLFGNEYQACCFAMICHHCGQCYVEFFPNATQESLFIGMIHAFVYMGIPEYVLTDNMKSVVIRRDEQGLPVWNQDYYQFMKVIGFKTKLCKPRHPFTKGKVERLVRFVKDNFLAGRAFSNITDLNYEALRWCNEQNSRYHKSVDCIPAEKHSRECLPAIEPLQKTLDVAFYLCPERRISFDGFVTYEGRRFGVPYWYARHTCRVHREQETLTVFSDDLKQKLASYDVTWSRRDSFCPDQYVKQMPEEVPSVSVKTIIRQVEGPRHDSGFAKFNFDREDF